MHGGILLVPLAEVLGAVSCGARRPSRWGEVAAARRLDLRPLAAGGAFAFIDRVRLLPLDGSSFVVAYQAKGEPGKPRTVRMAKISCFGPD